MMVNELIGFMQGRLSPMIDGKIQVFPWPYWQDEFPLAKKNGFSLMEWTLDQERLYENPLLTETGQAEIRSLGEEYDLSIPSLTGDCFMQTPFWKADGKDRQSLQDDFLAIARACTAIGTTIMVVPLVDNGKLESAEQEDILVKFLQIQSGFLAENGLKVAFESDFSPAELARFISRLDPALFGVNYDIGNSAALGFDPIVEMKCYGDRVINVHVKDRPLDGTTVPLGDGDANFELVFSLLNQAGYSGNYILQTARADNNDHAGTLSDFRDMTNVWLN